MSTLAIRDLPADRTLDHQSMSSVRGGMASGPAGIQANGNLYQDASNDNHSANYKDFWLGAGASPEPGGSPDAALPGSAVPSLEDVLRGSLINF
jgi:hypothetical protein